MSIYRIGGTIYKNLDNVGIGTTIPSHKLHIYSTSGLDNDYESTSVLLENLTSGEAAIAFRNSNVTAGGNVWFMGLNCNTARFDIGYGTQTTQLAEGSAVLSLLPAGNLGIGTTLPQAKVDISGGLQVGLPADGQTLLRFNTDRPWKFMQTGTNANTDLILKSESGGKYFWIQDSGSSNFAGFFAQGVSALSSMWAAQLSVGGSAYTVPPPGCLIVSGNVGIGTTIPVAKTHIYHAGTGDILRIDDQSADTTPLIINQDGNVGIGSTLPTQALDVFGAINMTTFLTVNDNSGTGSAILTTGGTLELCHTPGGGNPFIDFKNSFTDDFDMRIGLNNGTDFYLRTGGNGNTIESLRVNAQGNVGLGTAAPTHKLHVYSGSVTDNDYESAGMLLENGATGEVGIGFKNSNVGAGGNIWSMGISSNTTRFDIAYGYQSEQLNDGNPKISILTNGNVGIGSVIPTKKFDVNGDIQISGDIYKNGLSISSQWSNVNSTTIYYAGNVGVGSTVMVGGGNVFTVYGNANLSGNVGIGSTLAIGSMLINSYSRLNQYGILYASNSVGIGTSFPTKKLDVVGDINFSGDLYKGGALYVSSQWTCNSGARTLYYQDGNVGIGTTIATKNFDVLGDINFSGNIYQNGTLYATNANSAWSYCNSGIAYMGSNVGIGTTTPNRKLHVEGDAYINGTLYVNNYGDFVPYTVRTQLQVKPLTYSAVIAGNNSNTISLSGPGALKASASNVVAYRNGTRLGYYSPTVKDFDITSTTVSGGSTIFGLTFTDTFNYGDLVQLELWPDLMNSVDDAYAYTNFSNWTSNMLTGNIYRQYGNVGIGTTAPSYNLHVVGKIFATDSIVAFSDAALKTDVRPITAALSLVESMRGVRYKRIDTKEHQIGVIAQEVEPLIPEVVSTTNGGKAVSYGNLVAVLIEAVKELSEKVKILERKLA